MGTDVISPEEIIKKKVEQIIEYYFLHKKIKYIFESGYNPFEKYENKLYIIDIDWIDHWKKYSSYLKAEIYFDGTGIDNEKALKKSVKEMCKNMINTNEINFNGAIPPPMNNEMEKNYFCNKLIYNLEDFDCLINENNYRSFKKITNSNIIQINEIDLLINQNFIFLIFEKKLKIKCFCVLRKDLIQITIDFNSSTLEDENELNEIFKNFINFRIKKQNEKDLRDFWISFFEENSIEFLDIKNMEDEYGHYILRNDCLFLRNLLLEERIINNINFNNINYGRLLGFETIDIIRYMNATLQCLINTDILTTFLLNKNIFMKINKNKEKCELSSIYCDLLANVFFIQNTNSYNPKNFKELLIAKDYSFNKFEARNAKDLIDFILKEMNYELSRLGNKINNDKFMNDSLSMNQNDEKIMLNYFLYQFKNKNSIISQLFCSINKNKTQCQTCLDTIYNYESCFIFDFILSLVYDYCNNNNIYVYEKNGKITIPLYQCFNFYTSTQFLSYYSHCKKCDTKTYSNQKVQIISLSPTIIISLNRGNGENEFKYKVDFPEMLDLKNFVKMSYGDSRYQLKAVIAKLNDGKYIAYCKKQIDNKWYCYNDTFVTCCSDQDNDFKNGIAHILFYESISQKFNNVFIENYIYGKINTMYNFNNNNSQFNNINNGFNINNFNNNANNSNNFRNNNNQMINFNNNNISNNMNNMRRFNNFNNMEQMNNFNNNNINNQMNNMGQINNFNNNINNQMNNMGQMNNFNSNINNQINNFNNNNIINNQMNNMGQMINNNNYNTNFIINQMNNINNNNNNFANNQANDYTQLNNFIMNNQVTNKINLFNMMNISNLKQTNNMNDIENNYNFKTQFNFNNDNKNNKTNNNIDLNRSFNSINVNSISQKFNINLYNQNQNNDKPNYNMNQKNYSSNTYNQKNQNNNDSDKINVMNDMKKKMNIGNNNNNINNNFNINNYLNNVNNNQQ